MMHHQQIPVRNIQKGLVDVDFLCRSNSKHLKRLINTENEIIVDNVFTHIPFSNSFKIQQSIHCKDNELLVWIARKSERRWRNFFKFTFVCCPTSSFYPLSKRPWHHKVLRSQQSWGFCFPDKSQVFNQNTVKALNKYFILIQENNGTFVLGSSAHCLYFSSSCALLDMKVINGVRSKTRIQESTQHFLDSWRPRMSKNVDWQRLTLN